MREKFGDGKANNPWDPRTAAPSYRSSGKHSNQGVLVCVCARVSTEGWCVQTGAAGARLHHRGTHIQPGGGSCQTLHLRTCRPPGSCHAKVRAFIASQLRLQRVAAVPAPKTRPPAGSAGLSTPKAQELWGDFGHLLICLPTGINEFALIGCRSGGQLGSHSHHPATGIPLLRRHHSSITRL